LVETQIIPRIKGWGGRGKR